MEQIALCRERCTQVRRLGTQTMSRDRQQWRATVALITIVELECLAII